jgi:hypothetical protein
MVRVYHKVKAERSGVRMNPTAAVYLGANYRINLGTGTSGAGSSSAAQTLTGSGSPEGVVTAPPGTTFNRIDSGVFVQAYLKQTGTGNTGWVNYA